MSLLWCAKCGCLCQGPCASAFCVCVWCVCETHFAWVHEKVHRSLCVSLVFLCVVETMFVSLYGGASVDASARGLV